MALSIKSDILAGRPDRSAVHCVCVRPAARTSFCICICFACCGGGALMAARGSGRDATALADGDESKSSGVSEWSRVQRSATEPGALADGQGGRESGGELAQRGGSSWCGRQLYEPSRHCLFLPRILPSIMEPSGAPIMEWDARMRIAVATSVCGGGSQPRPCAAVRPSASLHDRHLSVCVVIPSIVSHCRLPFPSTSSGKQRPARRRLRGGGSAAGLA